MCILEGGEAVSLRVLLNKFVQSSIEIISFISVIVVPDGVISRWRELSSVSSSLSTCCG